MPEPAKLRSEQGVLRFAVVGWQYDERQDEWDDWLVVNAEWDGRLANYRLTDPALLARELADLVGGLRRVADTLPAEETFAFTEPLLRFDCRRIDRLGHIEVTARFGGEAAVGEWLRVEVVVDPSDLRRFADELAAWSTAYPPRGGAT